MEPWQSWALVGVIGAGTYYYYSTYRKAGARRAGQKALNGKIRQRTEGAVERSSSDGVEKQPKQKKNAATRVPRQAVASNGTEDDAKEQGQEQRLQSKSTRKQSGGKARGTAQRPALSPNRANGSPRNQSTEPDEEDNREFARQLSSLASGSGLRSTGSSTLQQGKPGKANGSTTDQTDSRDEQPTKDGVKRKHNRKKAGKEQETTNSASEQSSTAVTQTAPAHIASSTSSTAGFDADDDSSALTSSDFLPVAPRLDASGVSDMLDASDSGPSILRITQPEEWQTARPKHARKQQTPAEAETKRQRQNHARADARKLEIQEAERQRRVLMERQMRTARELERKEAERLESRQAARNQQAGLMASVPLANAWGDVRSGGTTAAVAEQGGTQSSSMLDTFETTKVDDPWADLDGWTEVAAKPSKTAEEKSVAGTTNGVLRGQSTEAERQT